MVIILLSLNPKLSFFSFHHLSWLVLYFGFLLGFHGLNQCKWVILMCFYLGFVSLSLFEFKVSTMFAVALWVYDFHFILYNITTEESSRNNIILLPVSFFLNHLHQEIQRLFLQHQPQRVQYWPLKRYSSATQFIFP